MLLAVYLVRRHRRRVRRQQSPLLPYSKGGKHQFEPVKPSDWEILPRQIAISKLGDGSDWELGRGSYGRVYRGVKDGVQVVAVKTIADAARRDLFVREIALMKYVSRDANIVQVSVGNGGGGTPPARAAGPRQPGLKQSKHRQLGSSL